MGVGFGRGKGQSVFCFVLAEGYAGRAHAEGWRGALAIKRRNACAWASGLRGKAQRTRLDRYSQCFVLVLAGAVRIAP